MTYFILRLQTQVINNVKFFHRINKSDYPITYEDSLLKVTINGLLFIGRKPRCLK